MEQALQQQYISKLEARYLPAMRKSNSPFPYMGQPLVYEPPTYNGGPMVKVVGGSNTGLKVPTYGLATYDPLWTIDPKGQHLPPKLYGVRI